MPNGATGRGQASAPSASQSPEISPPSNPKENYMEQDWYKGFWKSDALPLGLVVLMLLAVLVIALVSAR
jgi:hypothetical protein